jgi:hypothetical protein
VRSLPTWSLVAAIALLALSLGGCRKGRRSNFSHIRFTAGPVIQTQADPTADFSRYRTFTWSPNPNSPDPLVERHLARLACSMLEGLGYDYVDSADADLGISLSYANEYRTTSIPSRTVRVPVYDEDGNRVYGKVGSSVTIPGAKTEAFYPEIHLFVVDRDRYAAGAQHEAFVWTGHATGSSRLSDIRLTGQMMLLGLLDRFPRRYAGETPERDLGFAWTVLSPHAGPFYPVIVEVPKGSRAESFGLARWDIISRIDGRSTTGMSLPEVRRLLTEGSGDTAVLTVRRGEDERPLEVPRPAVGMPRRQAEPPVLPGVEEPPPGREAHPSFRHITFETWPTTDAQQDRSVSFFKYRTFNWRPHPDCEDPAIEEHLALIARGMIEGHGYEYVDSPDADFTISLLYRNDLGVRSRPSRAVGVPLSDDEDDAVSISFEAVEVRGATWDTFTPEVYLFVVDNGRRAAGEREGAVVWSGSSIGASRASDIRLTGQLMLWYMTDWFAPCLPVSVYLPEVRLGMGWAVASPDGRSFYPMALGVFDGKPAEQAGITWWDIISEVNGVSTEDKSLPEVRRLIEEGPKDTVRITVRRGRQEKTFELPRPPDAPPGSIPLPPEAQPYA